MGLFIRRPTEAVEAYRYEPDGSNCIELMHWLGAGEDHPDDDGDCGKSPIFFDDGKQILPGEWAMKHELGISVWADEDFRKDYINA